MDVQFTTDLYWLAVTALFTALLWMPYILGRIATQGLLKTLGNPDPEAPPPPAWQDRAMRAHRNGVENLAVFAPLVLVAAAAGLSNPTTAIAAQVYFWARLAHYVVYTAGIPVARTVTFFVGFAAQVIVALVILGVV